MDQQGVLEAIAEARIKTRRRATEEIEAIKARRQSELDKLEVAELALKGEEKSTDAPHIPARRGAHASAGPRSRIRRKRSAPASPQELADRRASVVRLLEEESDPPSFAQIVRTLGLSSHKTRTAIRELMGKGRVESIGTGSSTRYVLVDDGSRQLRRQAPTQGTLEERIVAVLEDRHQATVEELAQALRAVAQDVREACGRLQSEERIRMSRINDRPVYVLGVRP